MLTPGTSLAWKSYAYTRPVGTISGMIERPKSWSVERRASSRSVSTSVSQLADIDAADAARSDLTDAEWAALES